jgi:cysteinylglycine-S-conjugate dipeptidase
MGASHIEDKFRELAGVEPGLPLFGAGNLGERLWSGPAVTVIGIDVPPIDEAVAAVVPHARARS